MIPSGRYTHGRGIRGNVQGLIDLCTMAVVHEEEWLGPDRKPLRDGEPVILQVFHASGRGDASGVYGAGVAGPVLGAARYSGISREAVAKFGPYIEEMSITLLNPLIISTEARLADFSPDGFIPGNKKDMHAVGTAIRAYIEEQSHDGVVINVGTGQTNVQGLRSKRLRAMFGQSQVVHGFAVE